MTERLLRADLHVHSYHSGYAHHLRFLGTRDCYSAPEDVYRTAKARGMDLVTITDHDSIDGCRAFLDLHPDAGDFFVSEEIECRFPGLPLKVHVGAYGIDERIHREIQPLRANVYEATAYLRQERVLFALNHLCFFFERQMPFDAYLRAMLPLFPAFETRNGTMLADHNALVEAVVRQAGRTGETGGSDAHTLRGVATTYTEAPGSTIQEFLASVGAGRGRVGGAHGGTWRVATEIYGVIGAYCASLVGLRPQELSWARRGVGIAFAIATMPGEFIPFLIAALDKRKEARRIAACRSEWLAISGSGELSSSAAFVADTL